ncbi:hypothetical protein J4732_18690, partial [Serratia marcescens]|nr:hypothetical protein [Serratia marcescens]
MMEAGVTRVMRQYGTGSDLQKAAGGNGGAGRHWRAITGRVRASGASPYLATKSRNGSAKTTLRPTRWRTR